MAGLLITDIWLWAWLWVLLVNLPPVFFKCSFYACDTNGKAIGQMGTQKYGKKIVEAV